jgi:hypothetical protein
LFKDATAGIGDQESGSPGFGADRMTPAWGAAMAVVTLRRCDLTTWVCLVRRVLRSRRVRARDVLGRYTTVQELSQLDSLDAIVAAVERNRG